MYWFIFFGYIFRNKITESYDSSVFRETSKLYSIKPMAIFLPRNARGSFFSTSFTALVIFCLFDNSHSNKSESIPHYDFHLRFPDDQWCGVYFYIPNGHLYVFLEKKNAYSSPFPIFKINFFDIFLLLGCLRSSHVLDINSLSDLWFASIFPSTSCLFIMMIVFFAVQKHFDIVHLYMFAFDFWAFGATFKKSSPMSRIFPSMFSSSFYSIKYYI